MKFKGFSDPSLNLGFLDVKLTKTLHLHRFCCSGCGFLTKEIFLNDCNHICCNQCVLVLNEVYHNVGAMNAYCGLCLGVVSCMRMKINEAFIAQLECQCPMCDVALHVQELKLHLDSCMLEQKPIYYTIEKSTSQLSTTSTHSSRLSVFERLSACVPARKTSRTTRHELVNMILNMNKVVSTDMKLFRQDLKRIEERMSEYQARYHAVTENVPATVCTLELLFDHQFEGVFCTKDITLYGKMVHFITSTTSRDVTMLVLTVGEREQNGEFLLSIREKSDIVYSSPVRKIIPDGILAGDVVKFANVFWRCPKNQASLRVKLEAIVFTR